MHDDGDGKLHLGEADKIQAEQYLQYNIAIRMKEGVVVELVDDHAPEDIQQ